MGHGLQPIILVLLENKNIQKIIDKIFIENTLSYSGCDTVPGNRNIATKTIDAILILTDFANLSSEGAQVLGSTVLGCDLT